MCASKQCRGIIQPEDFEALMDEWDERVRDAFGQIADVQQPLWKWIRDHRTIAECIANPDRIPSISWHRWRADNGHAHPLRPAQDLATPAGDTTL
jgi:hypothetical protein